MIQGFSSWPIILRVGKVVQLCRGKQEDLKEPDFGPSSLVTGTARKKEIQRFTQK
jgi:hypothetical protein